MVNFAPVSPGVGKELVVHCGGSLGACEELVVQYGGSLWAGPPGFLKFQRSSSHKRGLLMLTF